MKRKIVTAIILSLLVTVADCGQTVNDTDNDVAAIRQPENTETLTTTETTAPDISESETSKTEAVESEIVAQPKVIYIDFANSDVCFFETEVSEAPFSLSLVSEQQNGISEIPDWFTDNDLFLPMLGEAWTKYIVPNENTPVVASGLSLEHNVFYDNSYIYVWTVSSLDIYDRSTEQLLYTVCYQTDQWYLMGNCAYLQDGILYIGYIRNGYARPGTCYLLAYDIENETVIWRSEDQTYNSMNFIVKDDVIICGYGFTDENDYIYQIDMNSGKVLSKTEVKKMPDLLVEKDGQLYVHTYSYDYVFTID